MKWKDFTKMGAAACVVAAFCAAAPVFAQDEGQAAAAEQANGPADEVVKPTVEKVFSALMKFRRARGSVEIRKPGEERWEAVTEGRYYPLGSSVRARPTQGENVRVEVSFGAKCLLWATNAVEFGTRPIELGDGSRTVELRSGRINLDLPRALKDGFFFVSAPFFNCSNIAGESWFDYRPTGDGDEAVVHCKTGTMTLTGRHYKIERMAAAHQVRIRSTADDLFSWIRGESGANKIQLLRGTIAEKNFETGEVKDVEPDPLTYPLAPKNAVKIFRRRAPVGGNMVVSVMTFDAAGEIQNRYVFAEGRSNVNSGELVVKPVLVTKSNDAAKPGAKDGAADGKAADGNPVKKAAVAKASAPQEEEGEEPAAEEKPAPAKKADAEAAEEEAADEKPAKKANEKKVDEKKADEKKVDEKKKDDGKMPVLGVD